MDIPQSVMIWGLPQKTSLDDDTAGAVQDVEIPHIPAPESSQEEEEYGLTSSISQAGLNSSSGDRQTPEEDDYLAPLFGSSSSQDQESSAQLEETLTERETTETEFYKKLFLSVLTKAEQEN